jgi:23S rRNA G2069 N7-methylase RlmK/C1962 C5-methylase RlmI
VAENAARNGLSERVRTLQGDAFEVLRGLKDQGRRFDTVLLDPPAFIKRRKDEKEGTQAYSRLNRLGLELIEPGGLLVTSSCSFHLSRDAFLRAVQGRGAAPGSRCSSWRSASRARTTRCTRRSPRPPTSRPSICGCCRPSEHAQRLGRPLPSGVGHATI